MSTPTVVAPVHDAVAIGADLHRLLDALAADVSNARASSDAWGNVGIDEMPRIFDLYRQYMGATEGSWVVPMYTARNGATAPVALVDAPSRDTLVRTAVVIDDGTGDTRSKLAIEAETLLGYTPLRKYVKVTGLLRRVLAKLDIMPLDEKSVNAYKVQMVRHYETHNKMAAPTWRLTKLADFALPVPEFVLRKAVAIKKELPQAEFYVDHLAVDPFLIVSLETIPDSVFNVPSRNLDLETQVYIEVWNEPKFEEGL